MSAPTWKEAIPQCADAETDGHGDMEREDVGVGGDVTSGKTWREV
jgi:hypothetical protein